MYIYLKHKQDQEYEHVFKNIYKISHVYHVYIIRLLKQILVKGCVQFVHEYTYAGWSFSMYILLKRYKFTGMYIIQFTCF